ncbi:MAG TPA: histidine kinase dimerization/phosphoacceptor domain -containing protein [Puia sp.]|nr:histidine kinase dimerization/phosphoacceptor domain -containing protein [Puia sp.]
MTNRIIACVVLLLGITTSYGQDITATEADSLYQRLDKPIPHRDRLDILFCLADLYVNKDGKYKHDVDNAVAYLKNEEQNNPELKSDELTGFQLLIASMIAKEKKQEKIGKEMAEKAVNILRNSNKFYLGRAYFYLSEYYQYSDRAELVEKIRLVELAVQCFAQSKYVEFHANSLKHLADLYEINEQRSKVLENLNFALKLYKSINYPKLSGVYVLFNRYYYLGGNYKLALDYGLMALKDAESNKDSTLLYCQINNYMAITLIHMKEREHAINYFKTALRIAEKYNNNTSVLLVMNNMVHNYIELKKPKEALDLMKSIPENLLVPNSEEGYILASLCYANIYFELKKYPETGFYCTQILNLFKAHMPRAQVVNDFYDLLIRYYLESGQYTLAGTYFQKIDSLSKKMGDPARIRENFYLAFRLDTAKESYRSAISNLLKYQHLHDSLFDESSSRQMQQLEIEYETQKNKNEIKIKDQDIVLLNQKNQLQHNSLEKAGLAKNFTFGTTALLLIIIALLYYQYLQKQKSNDVISGKNALLQHLVTEKEWLLKEIHHRVKNNLQMVMSLLNSQSVYIENDAALAAIRASQHRVHAMSLIHQKLYNSDNFSTIDMSLYVRELVSYLSNAFDIGQRIRFEFNIEPLELEVSQAIPLGLILNEAITNSIKYAFPDNKNGLIIISLSNTSANRYMLCIRDNGTGISDYVNSKHSDSLGMSLMAGLSKDLEGNFSIKNDNGTLIKISFIHDMKIKRPGMLKWQVPWQQDS